MLYFDTVSMDASEMPNDPYAVRMDDLLLDAVGHQMSVPDDPARGGVDGELVRILSVWRLGVCSEPLRDLVDTDTALSAIGSSVKRRKSDRLLYWIDLITLWLIYATVAFVCLLIAVGG